MRDRDLERAFHETAIQMAREMKTQERLARTEGPPVPWGTDYCEMRLYREAYFMACDSLADVTKQLEAAIAELRQAQQRIAAAIDAEGER